MKNTVTLKRLSTCYSCNLKGFFCYTPMGADYESCPCCGGFDFLNDYCTRAMWRDEITRYDFLFEDEYQDDMRAKFRYCDKCNIMFVLGCVHRVGGCTENAFNCHFIKKWINKNTGEVNEGMPLFDDVDDWFDNANNVEVVSLYCPHKGSKCSDEKYKNDDKCDLETI